MDFYELASETSDAVNKSRSENVDVVGPSVMKNVPYHLQIRVPRSTQHRQRRREVVGTLGFFDQVPADAIAGAMYSNLL
jgi:hypothetical protein